MDVYPKLTLLYGAVVLNLSDDDRIKDYDINPDNTLTLEEV